MRKLRITMMSTALSVLMLAAGCHSSSPATTEEQAKAPAVPASATLKFVIAMEDGELPEGTDVNQNPYVDFVEEHTGVNLQLIVPQKSNVQESLSSFINSEIAPDLIHTSDPSWILTQVDLELLTPLDELLQTDHQELLRLFPEEAWEAVTFQGKIYAIPSMAEVPGNEVMYARKDWLDAVNLEPPETLEEYYDVMYAFTYSDPDGNGKDDTWGLTILPNNLSRAAPFFGAFGVPRGDNPIMQWKEKNGKLVYSGTLPEMSKALAYLRKLYGDGLLDREFILNKEFTFEEKIIKGKVGLFAGNWYDSAGPIRANMARDPDAEWIRLPYPTGPNGESGTANMGLVQSYSVIPKGSKHASKVLDVLTFIAGEGYHELALGIQAEEGAGPFIPLYKIANSIQPEVRKQRLDALGEQVSDDAEYVLEHVLRSDYKGPPTSSMSRFGEQLTELQNEIFLQYIMGLISQEDLKRFETQWKLGGGWEVNYEIEQWYREQQGEGQGE